MMVHCSGWEASVRAVRFLCFNSGGILGEDLVPVRCV